MIAPRLRRLLLWVALPVLVLLLLYTVLGFFLVPHLIRSGVHDFVAKNYHREVTLGEVRFNPWTLRLDVSNFALPDHDGDPMLGFTHLLVDVTVASLWHLGPEFEAIRLDDPYAEVLIHPDGELNLSELSLPPDPQAKPKPADSSPVRLFINHFVVSGGRVAFEDRAHANAFRSELKPITFDLRNFATVGKGGGTYALSGASDAGETFSWSGSLSPLPLASHGQFQVGNLQAQTIWKYIRDGVNFELPTGVVSVNGEYDFTTATTPIGLSVNVHQVSVSNLGVRPRGATQDYVTLARLDINDTRADVAAHSLQVGRIHLDGAEIRAWLPGNAPATVNLLELAGTPANGPGPPGKTTPANAATSEQPPDPAPATPPAAATATTSAPPASATTAAPAAPGTSPDTTSPWVVSVPDIALNNLKISAEDRTVSPAAALVLDGLNIEVKGFSTARTSPLDLTVATAVNHTGHLKVAAQVAADLSGAKGDLTLDNLDLTALQPYVARQTAMTLKGGQLSSALKLEGTAEGHLDVRGDVTVAKLRTVDNELKRDFIKFDQLRIAGIEYDGTPAAPDKPASLRIHDITARAPYARVIIESDRSVNVSRVLSGPAGSHPDPKPAASGAIGDDPATPTKLSAHPIAAPAPAEKPAPSGQSGKAGKAAKPGKPGKSAAAPAATSPLHIQVDAINIQDGSANYADLWIQPHFAVGIQGLGGSIRGLSSDPAARARVELKGKVDRYAPIHIWGETNPLAATAFSDIKMNFKGVELSSATPYSGRFAGYKIEKGKLSVDINYLIKNRQLTAAHKVVIDQLELGERVESPDAVHLPLKIAVALLKDRNGVIDIDLPVTGSLDDPQFRVGPLIWKAVLNLLTKIATAPFALIGHLFGGGEEMSHIDFSAGSAFLEPPEHDKLNTLVKALKEKEKLELDVPVTFIPEVDRAALATAQLDATLLALKDQQGTKKGGHKKASAAPAQSDSSAASTQTPPEPGSGAADPFQANNGADAGNAAHLSPLVDAAASADPALTDPAQRFHLLVAAYRAQFGAGTTLPAAAQAADKPKKTDPPVDYAAVNAELQTALLQKITVSDAELEALGKHRARAIQDVLLLGTDIDPSRVFVIGSAPKGEPGKDNKVSVNLALK